ncbi:hypothetical protein NPIL_479851 [Nephila pilipes]|uniref:Uncharacterized protein n=1 Tax=Nephila pilipes TaxID=299642 RepID=A0A8X6MMV2_NEPPI|nr:hypothetical protein NPIL_479851 [Nephila pilipes]
MCQARDFSIDLLCNNTRRPHENRRGGKGGASSKQTHDPRANKMRRKKSTYGNIQGQSVKEVQIQIMSTGNSWVNGRHTQNEERKGKSSVKGSNNRIMSTEGCEAPKEGRNS